MTNRSPTFGLLMFFCLPVLWGCAAIIIPSSENQVMSGRKITSENTAFIKPGFTTRDEVIKELGRPDMDLKDSRTIAYCWEVLDAYMPWIIGGHYSAVGGFAEIGKPYVLLINFDQDDRVSKFEIKERWPLDTVRSHAIKWIELESLDVPRPGNEFISSEIPKGQAVIYIYRPGGWRDAPLLRQPVVGIDGEMVAELHKGGYIASLLQPGFHTVSVNPESSSTSILKPDERPVRRFSFDALPDTAYYLKVIVRYGMGALDPELTILPAEDAVPVLKELKPTW
jgi:hypothetical protein